MRYHLFVAALLIGAAPVAAQGPAVVIRNATVETMTDAGRLEHVTVVLRDGKIEAVGKDVLIPDDATFIDAEGGTLLPGIIDPHFQINVAGAAQADPAPADAGGRRGGRGGAPAGGGGGRGGFTRVADNFYPYDAGYRTLPRAGLTRLNLVTSGVGQSALIRLTPTEPGQMLAQPDGVAYVTVTNQSESLDQVRTRLEAASSGRGRAGGARGGRGGRGGAGTQTAETRLWQQIHDGQASLIATATSGAAIVQLMKALEPYPNVRLVLNTTGVGVYEAIDALQGRNVRVILRPSLDQVPNTRDRFNASRLLHEAGIEIAFTMTAGGGGAGDGESSSGLADQDFPLFPVAMLVKTGLPRATALRALTEQPAIILGLDKTHGTIEPGKAADLLLFTGDPLDPSSRLRLTLIDGRTIYEN